MKAAASIEKTFKNANIILNRRNVTSEADHLNAYGRKRTGI